MDENADAVPALNRLTPALGVEVRWGLVVGLTIVVAATAAFSALFAVSVDPDLSEVTRGVAVRMFALVAGLLAAWVGLLLTLVYLFGCWPAVLRSRFLRVRYGVAPGELSGPAWRRAMGAGGFWAAAGRGAVVGWAFVSAVGLAVWGLTGEWSLGGSSGGIVVMSATVAARAWFVRRAVAGAAADRMQRGSDRI